MKKITVAMLDGVMCAVNNVSYFDGDYSEIWSGLGIVPEWLANAEVCSIDISENGVMSVYCAIEYDFDLGEWVTY